MALIFVDGEWQIPCVQYRVDDNGKPIQGSAVNTSMRAADAAAALMAYTGRIGPRREILTQEVIKRDSIELKTQ